MPILIDPPRSAYERLMDRIASNHLRTLKEQQERSAELFHRLLIANRIDQLRRSAGLPLGHQWKFHTVYRLDLSGDQQKGGK